jgi:hypothetical protein
LTFWGGLLRLWNILKEKKNTNVFPMTIVNFTRAFSALISSPLLFKTKKGESRFFGCVVIMAVS